MWPGSPENACKEETMRRHSFLVRILSSIHNDRRRLFVAAASTLPHGSHNGSVRKASGPRHQKPGPRASASELTINPHRPVVEAWPCSKVVTVTTPPLPTKVEAQATTRSLTPAIIN